MAGSAIGSHKKLQRGLISMLTLRNEYFIRKIEGREFQEERTAKAKTRCMKDHKASVLHLKYSEYREVKKRFSRRQCEAFDEFHHEKNMTSACLSQPGL